MEPKDALKRIINMGHSKSLPYPKATLDKMTDVDLALTAADAAIQWGGDHIVTIKEVEEFKNGLRKIVDALQ